MADDEKLAFYKEIFELFDEDGNGSLCAKELEAMLQCAKYNPTPEEMRECMSNFDKDGDEKITFDEYKAFMEMTEGRMGTPEEQEEKLIEAFKVFDKDGSGFLDRAEIKDLLMKLEGEAEEERIEELLEQADTNKDGQISIIEFVAHMNCKKSG